MQNFNVDDSTTSLRGELDAEVDGGNSTLIQEQRDALARLTSRRVWIGNL